MNEFGRIAINCKVALVACVLDDYTSKPVTNGKISVFLEGIQQKPINKNGYYVFTNLEDGIYTLRVSSRDYFDGTAAVDTGKLKNSEPVVYVRLRPKPGYPFSAGASLLRMSLQDSKGNRLENALVHAAVVTEDNYRAKLVQQQVKKGKDRLTVIYAGNGPTRGEELFILDGDKSEYCSVDACESYEEGIIKLMQPVKYEHSQGTLLMPAVRTLTDDRGEAVIYFRYSAAKTFEVQLRLEYKRKSVSGSAVIEQGKSLYLGLINIDSQKLK